jgi:hypothetical protein
MLASDPRVHTLLCACHFGGCAVSGATPPDASVVASAADTDDDGEESTVPVTDDSSSEIPDTDDSDPLPGDDDVEGVPDAGSAMDATVVMPPPPPTDCTGDASMPTATDAGLAVRYRPGGDAPTDQEIKPYLIVENRGSADVALSELTLTYWFTREGDERTILVECDYAALGCAMLSYASGAACGTGVDAYVRIGFVGGELAAGASTGEMQLRVHKDDWSSFDESDDYSYAPGALDFTDHARVTLSWRGELVWGELPR